MRWSASLSPFWGAARSIHVIAEGVLSVRMFEKLLLKTSPLYDPVARLGGMFAAYLASLPDDDPLKQHLMDPRHTLTIRCHPGYRSMMIELLEDDVRSAWTILDLSPTPQSGAAAGSVAS
jgi:hypothetical protein